MYGHPLNTGGCFCFQVTFLSGPFKEFLSKICFSLIFKCKSSYIIACGLISAMLGKWNLLFRHCDATKRHWKMRLNWRAILDETDHDSERSRSGWENGRFYEGFIKDIQRKLDGNKYFAVWLAWCQTMPQDANMQSIYIYFDCKLTRYLSLSQKTNCHEEI